MSFRGGIVGLFCAAAACSPSSPITEAPPQTATEPPAAAIEPVFELKTPSVVMEASPVPPFTYWAPEGSTIRNHANVPGVWSAFVNGKQVENYWGDACHASEYQRYVGGSLAQVPAPPDGIVVRQACETCPVTADARPDRMNVIFHETDRTVLRIACY